MSLQKGAYPQPTFAGENLKTAKQPSYMDLELQAMAEKEAEARTVSETDRPAQGFISHQLNRYFELNKRLENQIARLNNNILKITGVEQKHSEPDLPQDNSLASAIEYLNDRLDRNIDAISAANSHLDEML